VSVGFVIGHNEKDRAWLARPAPTDEVITAGVGLYLYREDPSDSKELAALFADMDGDEDRLPS